MSREFGEYGGCGYFHTKLANALEDAQGGRTDGAKVMAAFLKPLADMAYDVASEEAHDSGPDSVMQCFADSLPAMRQAMHALECHVQPATRYAASVLANTLRPYSTIMPRSPGHFDVRLKHDRPEKDADWDVFRQALVEMVAKERNFRGYWSGSSSHSTNDYTDHHITAWDHAERVQWLSSEVNRLTKEVALLRALKQKELATDGTENQ